MCWCYGMIFGYWALVVQAKRWRDIYCIVDVSDELNMFFNYDENLHGFWNCHNQMQIIVFCQKLFEKKKMKKNTRKKETKWLTSQGLNWCYLLFYCVNENCILYISGHSCSPQICTWSWSTGQKQENLTKMSSMR